MDLRMSLSLLVLAGSIGMITAIAIDFPIDCSFVRCGLPPKCNREDLVTPPGQCCPICRPDCSVVLCPREPECEKGANLQVLVGECCPICVPGLACVTASCARLFCAEGYTLEVPEGECCPICVKEG